MICHGWEIGLVDHMMREDMMVGALNFYPGDSGSNPDRDEGFFQTMHHYLVPIFYIRKMGARPGCTNFESYNHKNGILVIIDDYSLESCVCFVPLQKTLRPYRKLEITVHIIKMVVMSKYSKSILNLPQTHEA